MIVHRSLTTIVVVIAVLSYSHASGAAAPDELVDHIDGPSLDGTSANTSQSLDMTSAEMEAAITDLMLGKTAFGATPMGGSVKKIKDLLTKTMMPKVIAAHKADQNQLNRLVKEIAKCGTTKDSALKGAKVSFNKFKKESRYHKSCRGDEAVKYTSKKNCLAQQKSLYNIKVLKCKAFVEISKKWGATKNNKAVVSKGASESVESYVTRLSVTFCGKHVHGSKGTKKGTGGWGGGLAGGMLDQYLRAKEACQRATRNYSNKVKECKRKIHAYNVRKAKCNQYQTLMDAASCKSAVLEKDACETYAGCYYSKVKAYRIVEAKVRFEEIDRKAEWRGLKRMDCLINAFADGKVTNAEVDTCKKKTVSTSHLNIKYPKVPPLKKCTVSQLYPSTGTYKKAEFAPLPLLAKGKESVECSGVAEISLKAASGSPTSCKCKRVTLNGPYSAGPMVKCTGCRDVRTANQKNSCPLGTKIFSPASKSDWQTFFSSAGSLYAPHWIIDVTRPKNGCGGCTSNPMNSGNRKQQSWSTSDGSPWWLRSTRYSEPNGDYNANCFLNLWNNPRRASAVTFNDGRCNYHAKSYYCQLQKMDLMPKSGSPKSCKCRLLTLSGAYSAGKLVKCEQCLTVYKSNQKNSCPKGMKIFSPRIRGDWKTFIASAGPLRAPHWIIDVTRPQNGCGGCTRYSMKSTTPQQATWRTSDRSPWWLRNSLYNEPNGDYTANCFLDLWQKPSSVSSVTFNDGRCNYRSRSYYCQPIKTKPKPKPAPKKSKIKGFKVGLKWIQSAKGDTCINTCKKVSASCADQKFPKSIGAFKDIVKNMKHKTCKSIQTGSWQYNPTQAPSNACYWRGRGSNRCRGKYKSERRFCPCQVATWWMRGNKGESCAKACSRVGKKCVENKWPKAASEMTKILATTGAACSSMQVGSWKFNPTYASSGSCYWRGKGTARCSGKHSGERRFCPCE